MHVLRMPIFISTGFPPRVRVSCEYSGRLHMKEHFITCQRWFNHIRLHHWINAMHCVSYVNLNLTGFPPRVSRGFGFIVLQDDSIWKNMSSKTSNFVYHHYQTTTLQRCPWTPGPSGVLSRRPCFVLRMLIQVQQVFQLGFLEGQGLLWYRTASSERTHHGKPLNIYITTGFTLIESHLTATLNPCISNIGLQFKSFVSKFYICKT